MLSEPQINQRWVKLLTAHGAKFGPPDKSWARPQRYGIGFYCEALSEAGVDEHLAQMFEAIKNTSKDEGFKLSDVRATTLEFGNETSTGTNARLATALFYAPARPAKL
jgi:hypothetical protein